MVRFARGSAAWLLAPLLLAAGLALLGAWTGHLYWWVLACLPAAVFLFFLVFFRDPERIAGEGMVSPADGKVRLTDTVQDPELGTMDRLSIFMSPKDVHVNRMPVAGTVVSVTRRAGGYVPAFRKEADVNERVEIVLDTAHGRLKVVQVAGAVARRIVPYIEPGQVLGKGDRMGLIRLGSRCDLLVPPGRVNWRVAAGQQVYAGTTQVGDLL